MEILCAHSLPCTEKEINEKCSFATKPLFTFYNLVSTRQKFDSLETGESMFTINRKYEADKDRISIIELTMSVFTFYRECVLVYGANSSLSYYITTVYQKNLHAYVTKTIRIRN